MADIQKLLSVSPSKTADGHNNAYRGSICSCCGADFTDSVVNDTAGWGITLSITDKPEPLPEPEPEFRYEQVEIDGVHFNLKLRR